MTEHADAPSNAAHLFEIIRTTRSMRRLKPDRVPNELIRKILEAAYVRRAVEICSAGGSWWSVIRRVKEIVGALHKRAWNEQVAPRYRSGEPAPGMSRERFLRLLDAAEYLAAHIHEGPGLDRPLPRRRHADPHIRLVNLSCGAEHAACSASARPWRDVDDAVLAIREGSGGRSRPAARRPRLCPAADRLSDGPVRAGSPSPSCRCRLRRSVGRALPGSVATEASSVIAKTAKTTGSAICQPRLSSFVDPEGALVTTVVHDAILKQMPAGQAFVHRKCDRNATVVE